MISALAPCANPPTHTMGTGVRRTKFSRMADPHDAPPGDGPPAPPRLLDQLRAVMRLRHYSIRTEAAYVGWVHRYIHFHGLRHQRDMGPPRSRPS